MSVGRPGYNAAARMRNRSQRACASDMAMASSRRTTLSANTRLAEPGLRSHESLVLDTSLMLPEPSRKPASHPILLPHWPDLRQRKAITPICPCRIIAIPPIYRQALPQSLRTIPCSFWWVFLGWHGLGGSLNRPSCFFLPIHRAWSPVTQGGKPPDGWPVVLAPYLSPR